MALVETRTRHDTGFIAFDITAKRNALSRVFKHR